jgi:hypothetical protein
VATRILILFLIALLALPVTEVSEPVQARMQIHDPAIPSVEANKHKHKKKKKPKFMTVTRTVRESVTQTFADTSLMAIPRTGTFGKANPYPSIIDVSGFVNGAITDVNLTLHGFGHTAPGDVDILLVPAHLPGLNAIVMSDTGSDPDVGFITLTLDDQAAAELPENPVSGLVGGTFKPTNFGALADIFPDQTPSGNSLLSVFNGSNPNGPWQLLIVDDNLTNTGQLSEGWSLQITAQGDRQIQEQVKITNTKKRKKR